ncbi:hypothetical protein COV93_06290 [Candidatus Woesearchaeota archaeon CG11_big_fil_rev_8_21_14_0_20_43_8]|nr:MAG: hypothetical protein COV93_06290 [Candidatus Woesearchaeota archaeon CG11_big_fil_rev_8_21_14_0_20_43_8]PIO07988.1 MAG: hypothetical protein COT47_01285 [Candidatus Woesearchaeota archaeon CG08_land_8_20_14_0_20_43_7]
MSKKEGKGKFVMVDGLDGSGKGVIVTGLQKWAAKNNLKVFDLREHCKKHLDLPEVDDLDCDVILSAEPTYSHVGRVIREELIKNSDTRKYSGHITAHAFSLDRKVLYKKVILPALERGIHVFQERGVITSLVYQPMQMEEMLVGQILGMPGNKFAMENAPDLLVVTMLEPEEAIHRLAHRNSKQDDHIFERLEFQKKVKDRYTSDWLRELFEKNGSIVHYFDTSSPMTPKDTEDGAIRLFEDFMKNH